MSGDRAARVMLFEILSTLMGNEGQESLENLIRVWDAAIWELKGIPLWTVSAHQLIVSDLHVGILNTIANKPKVIAYCAC